MQNPTPTRQELSSYFFDRSTPKISNKVERWFFKNGNSQEAKKLLFSLWEELEDIIYFSRRDTSRFRAIQSPTTELRTPRKQV